MASLRATGIATRNADDIRLRQLADWVAQDRLEEHRARGDWLPIGGSNGEIEQGGYRFRWEENISGTPNAQFRRIEIRVRAAELPDDAALAHLSGFLVRQDGK
jgi:general secretion pathway protein I